jgi:hypothetical protein
LVWDYITTFNPRTGWAQPSDLAFGPQGHLFVTDNNGISQFDFTNLSSLEPWPFGSADTSSGDFVVYASSVPEPDSLTLLALGGLGLLFLRR